MWSDQDSMRSSGKDETSGGSGEGGRASETGDIPQNRRAVVGGTFIVLGIILFFMQVFEGRGETLLFLLLGAVFIAGYFHRQTYGLLIPGCILAGLGLGMLADRLPWGVDSFEAVGLGVGFIAIFVIDLAVRSRTHWWPLVPGVILFVGGVGTGYRAVNWVLETGWPLIFVVIGVLVLLGRIGGRERRP